LNGSTIVAVVDTEIVSDDAGRAAGAIGVLRDNTEQHRRQTRLIDHQRRIEELLQALPAAVYTTDAAGRITFFNEAAVDLWGVRPELGKSEFCGSWKLYWPDGTPLPHAQCPMAMALKEQQEIRGMEAAAERPDGTRVHFLAYPTPLFDANGTLTGAVNMLLDATPINAANLTAQRLAAIVESSEDAIIAKNLDGVIISWNNGATRLFGYEAQEIIGRPVTMLIPPERQDEEPAILDKIRCGERVEPYETVRRRKDGSFVDIRLTVSPVRDGRGTVVGASKIAHDISNRKRAEEQQQALLREMNHRVKNLFALASGLVRLNARSTRTAAELAAAVTDRFSALARAHALTLRDPANQDSAEPAPTTLHSLVRAILLPYDDPSHSQMSRIDVAGADIRLSQNAVTSLALLLYEFATNAAKYGALSTPRGRIRFECAEQGDAFAMVWSERNGPPVNPSLRDAVHEGFGEDLIRVTVERQLGGEIARDWKPEGLAIRVTLPRERVAAPSPRPICR
jgi:PAS domain S-box-containing protein